MCEPGLWAHESSFWNLWLCTFGHPWWRIVYAPVQQWTTDYSLSYVVVGMPLVWNNYFNFEHIVQWLSLSHTLPVPFEAVMLSLGSPVGAMKENKNLTNCISFLSASCWCSCVIFWSLCPSLCTPFSLCFQVKVSHRCITLDHVGSTMPWCWSFSALAWRTCLTSVTGPLLWRLC